MVEAVDVWNVGGDPKHGLDSRSHTRRRRSKPARVCRAPCRHAGRE